WCSGHLYRPFGREAGKGGRALFSMSEELGARGPLSTTRRGLFQPGPSVSTGGTREKGSDPIFCATGGCGKKGPDPFCIAPRGAAKRNVTFRGADDRLTVSAAKGSRT